MSYENSPDYGGGPWKWWYWLLMPAGVVVVMALLWLLVKINSA